jgi:hypothetical protein
VYKYLTSICNCIDSEVWVWVWVLGEGKGVINNVGAPRPTHSHINVYTSVGVDWCITSCLYEKNGGA